MRNIKILGLAFVAMLAFSAIGAATASADDLTAESYPATLTGAKDGTFQDSFLTTAGLVTCDTPTYKASVSAATTSVDVTPDYQSMPGHVGGPHFAPCRAAGVPASITMGTCIYRFNIGAGTSGDVDLVCPGGDSVTVTAAAATSATHKCTVHIKGQNDIGGTVVYANTGSGTTRDITVEVSLTGIDYNHTAGTGLGACTSGSSTTGTLTAKAVISGDVGTGSTHNGIFLS